MRIAYFNANLNPGQDGVSRCVHRMMDGALQRGHEVIAVASAFPDRPSDGRSAAAPIHRVPSVPLPLQRDYRIALPAQRLFARRMDDFAPDVIHVNSPCTLGYAAVQYARRAGLPVVATYHTHFPTYPRYYRLRPLERAVWGLTRLFYNSVDLTFVPTEPILDELRAHRVQRLQYLPNGFDAARFSPAFRSEEWRSRFNAGDAPILLFVSRLVWEKNLRVLAETEAMLRARGSHHVTVIVGDGHARRDIEAMMPDAHFLGYQEGRALSECYASSDVFVFPSVTETFGLVTLEAMASGLAPVAASSGGAAEIIRHGTSGFLARPDDANDLAVQLQPLLGRADLRRAIAAGAVRRAHAYEWEHILERLFLHYEDIRARHACEHYALAA